MPNSGFSEYTTCPNTEDQVHYCVGWNKCSSGGSRNTTPDYFHSCDTSPLAYNRGVPFKHYVDRFSCDTGAFMGLFTYGSNAVNYREHIGVQLEHPLIIGQKYYISFYVVMGTGTDGVTTFFNPSNNIGIRFTSIVYNETNPVPIDNFAHLRVDSQITDTLNWTHVLGSIVADSSYTRLMIGNFYDDSHTDFSFVDCSNSCANLCYYFVDDICVSTASTLCSSSANICTSLSECTTTNGCASTNSITSLITETNATNSFSFSPNPVTTNFYINNPYPLTPYDLVVYNAVGQILYEEKNIITQTKTVNSSSFSQGVLFINIKSKEQQTNFKLFKL